MSSASTAIPTPGASRVPFSRAVAAVTLLYTIGMVLAWYAAEGTWFGQGAMVPPIFTSGAVVFFVALWVKERVAPWHLSRDTLTVAVSSILLLSLLWYFGRMGSFRSWFAGVRFRGPLGPLYPFFYFSACCVLCRSVLPMVVARFALRRRPADYGYRLRGTFELWWVYLAAVAVVVPVVVVASTFPVFYERYPLGRELIIGGRVSLVHFVIYQLAYGLLFASGESFWRGYILFGVERDLGRLSLFFMLGLYTFAHLGKPAAEALCSVAAGLFLGYLALRHRSFWLGVAVHWFIALLMDLLALFRRGVEWV